MDRHSSSDSAWETSNPSLGLTSARDASDSSDAPEACVRGQPIVSNSPLVQTYTSIGGGPTMMPLVLYDGSSFMHYNFMVNPYGYHSIASTQAQGPRDNQTLHSATGRNVFDASAYDPEAQLPVPIFTTNNFRNHVSRLDHPWGRVPVPTQGTCGADDVSTQWQMDLGSVYYDTQAHKYYYRCYICSEGSIGRPQDLKRHVQNFHGIAAIACKYPGCEQFFPKARPDYLRRHLERYHGPQGAQQQ